MHLVDYTTIFVFLLAIVLLTKPLGLMMYSIFEENKKISLLNKFENYFLKILKIDKNANMDWKGYTYSLLIFNGIGFLFVFLIQLFQSYLPFNPQNLPNVEPTLAFNTAVSFMTNTNWQSYSGENTLSYFVQAIGLTVQNFVSAATGIAVFLSISRGIRNKMTSNLGNFWVDITRTTLFILLPLSTILAIILVSQGVVQNFNQYTEIITLEGFKQIIPNGMAASQIAIKQLGTNGGGFFGTNSAFPYENPTALSNLFQMLSILLIPAALTYTYGKIVGSTRQGWTIFSVMIIMLIIGLSVSLYSEFSMNPNLNIAGNMEGKETRFGITNSVIWSTATTAASNGSVNSMHESLMPLTGMVAMINIMTGEVIFGGVGAGIYGMLVFIILTVFIAGLMIGRTPEYIGKKIQAKEVQMAIVAVIAPSFVILIFSSIALMIPAGLSRIYESGAHGFSEVIYAFSSAAGNNGSAFAGLGTNTPFYNIMMGIGMLIGRFAIIIPIMVIAGSLSIKNKVPTNQGTFRTDDMLFGFLLISVILVVGALTFLPALSLGPIVEHLTIILN